MKETITNLIQSSIDVKSALLKDENLIKQIETVANQMIDAYRHGKKIMFAGNGGSAADSQHLAAELVNRFQYDREGLASIALSTDSSIVSSIANDYGYENVFSRQVATQGVSGDVFVGISTSGNSENIVKALNVCKEKGIFSVGLTGGTGGKMALLCDVCIVVPSNVTARIQECHILIGHILCGLVEEAIFPRK